MNCNTNKVGNDMCNYEHLTKCISLKTMALLVFSNRTVTLVRDFGDCNIREITDTHFMRHMQLSYSLCMYINSHVT